MNDLFQADEPPAEIQAHGRTYVLKAETPKTGFSEFWAKCPNKVGKPAAEKAFKKLTAGDRAAATASMVRWYARWSKDCQGASTIHPSTYLNNRRWEDEGMTTQTASDEDNRTVVMRAIKSGKQYLCGGYSNALAREMVRKGLVTNEECRAVGLDGNPV